MAENTEYTRKQYSQKVNTWIKNNKKKYNYYKKNYPKDYLPRLQEKFWNQIFGTPFWQDHPSVNKKVNPLTGSLPDADNPGVDFRPENKGGSIGYKSKPTRKATRGSEARKLYEELSTPPDADSYAYGRKMTAAQKKGLVGDHVYDVSRTGKALSEMSPERQLLMHKRYKDAGIALGNQVENISEVTDAVNYAKNTQTNELDRLIKKAGTESDQIFKSILNSTKQTTNYSSIGGYLRTANKAAKAGQTGKALKAGIGLATVGSLAGLGPAGAALSAVDTYQRQQKYKQTGNKLDGIQAWMAGASTVTGATGIGEVVSMPLDIINLIVDAARYKRTGPFKGSRARFD